MREHCRESFRKLSGKFPPVKISGNFPSLILSDPVSAIGPNRLAATKQTQVFFYPDSALRPLGPRFDAREQLEEAEELSAGKEGSKICFIAQIKAVGHVW
jgi:hypothetical protein